MKNISQYVLILKIFREIHLIFSILYLFQILIINIIYIYHLLHKSREIIMYFETYFDLCANCWPTTPTFDPPSNSISSIVKCGKNSIGINAFLEKAYGCSLCRGFGRKMYREKYGLFVDNDDDDSLFWKEAYYCNFFPSRPLNSMTNFFLLIVLFCHHECLKNYDGSF